MTQERILAYALPAFVAAAVIGVWEWAVFALEVEPFRLPAPSAIFNATVANWNSLLDSTWVTIRITLTAFAVAFVLGVSLAVTFSQSRTVERALLPYAITLQVTPIVAIAPFVIIWVGNDNAERAVLILAVIVAFFPILANTTLGLRSADRQLHELFDLYRATRVQRLIKLQFPAALPYMLAGVKIAGGLALIGAVVAEMSAGSGTSTGLAWRIVESTYRLEMAKAFAALALLSAIGIAMYALLSLLERQLLQRWHESARPKE